MSVKEFETTETNTWCPGCGNFAILNAVKQALQQLGKVPDQVALVSGIGCHGKITDYVKANTLHVIHGRVLPAATALKICNSDLMVIGHAGDGDAMGIGLGHFAHAARRNVPISYIIHDNMVYGLTTGQTSPTSVQGFKTKTSPRGTTELPINPIMQALAAGVSFVARGYSGDMKHLIELFKEAFTFRGFSMVDVLQPCVSFNRVNTYDYYKTRVYNLQESSHDVTSIDASIQKAREWGDRIPIGVFYRVERPTYLEAFPALREKVLAWNQSSPDLAKLINEFR